MSGLASMPGGRRPLVLVADDDRDTRELYRACFDTSGYRTGEAETGSQAIAVSVEMTPDVLITDYVLPDVDGITIARRLKQDRRTARIRILMVTGYATPGLERRAAEAGVERVLLKPCLPQTVMREVARSLGRGEATLPSRDITATAAPHPPLDRRDEGERTIAVSRVRDEFAALPGLALTSEQARLVFELDRPAVERILDGLVAEGFLARTPQGAFRRPRS
jgi:two-component system cell cycle response regulator DivK